MSWCHEYSAALDSRDGKEKSQFEFFESYAKLANKAAQGLIQASHSTDPALQSVPPSTDLKTLESQASLKSIRLDLAEAQRSKVELQTNLKLVNDELQQVKRRSHIESKRILDLTNQRNMLITKTKDRDEELRGKSKLVEDVQDELISLQLQLNVAEERSSKLQKENKDLVDRWMARMGREADAMNDASKFK